MRVNKETIGNGEFYGRKIRVLELGGKVRRIEDSAFNNCPMLKEVAIPEGVETMGGFVFQDCISIRRFRIPSTLTDLAEDAFFIGRDGRLEEFVVDPGNPALCAVDGVLFSKDMRTLVQYPQCKPGDSYVVPGTVENIAPDAFAYCTGLKSIVLPEGLRTIGGGAFEWCEALTSIRIPQTVSSIPMYAFFCCYSLEDVVLPDRLEFLGAESFANCVKLKEFVFPPGFDQLDYALVGGCESLVSVLIPEGIRDVNNSAFIDCPNIKTIRLPSTVVAIWEKAFQRCSGLENINIPSEVYYVSEDAFAGCESLRTVYVEGDKIEWMGWVPEGAEVVVGNPPDSSDRSREE